MRPLALAALVSLSFGSLACASPEQPASMKPVVKAADGYSPDVRAVMEDHVALATGTKPPAARAAEGFGAPASDLVSVPPTRDQKQAACTPRADPASGKLVESQAKRVCVK